ncbi:superkiller complex protein 2-like isoform X1 [Babylonia areolata]|uniref:superkiller complex protein 2-like isoform X1 n=1 Tax=Babylonia areolata TaxID=304850 RepID=UPI003FD1E331
MAETELTRGLDLLELGCQGHLELVTKDEKCVSRLPLKTIPVGLPPALPEIQDELEEYLTKPECLSIHDFRRTQKYIPRERDPEALYLCDVCPLQTTIVVERNPATGHLLGYKEEYLPDSNKTSRNSLSLRRAPGPAYSDVRGSAANMPFWPGGLEEPSLDKLDEEASSSTTLNFETDLLTVAPGMLDGMTFANATKEATPTLPAEDSTSSDVINLADILAATDDLDLGDSDEEGTEEKGKTEKDNEDTAALAQVGKSESLENLVQVEEKKVDQEAAPKRKAERKKEQWAVMVDVNTPVSNFYKRVPDMAYKWPFEPDVFQKQAILHLERHESVFVAAHTSAGKTVVAEYAIALSLKHMTKTVYTSPIKALSNQKFRDFKTTFGDVGLITGDVQINTTAACLIMTTEILRSMLYNGSDVIRDLEWVIFDEVHYINDAERGVVWEEVLIMLPQHVNIILLSATVPNTMEFADWIGRTKRKHIYVISTTKRPVPLEHYLYTGNSNKTSSELFLLLDAKGSFLTAGYNKAVAAKKERASQSSQNFGAKGTRGGNPHQDKNVWLSVIEMLKKKDKLPMVAFVFSKRRIEDNIFNLQSVDLTTQAEKAEIHIFFHRCIQRLKGNDRQLPQVLHMENVLKRGLGVHHSGILPILKEVVEMLFQRGLVKILFATETFAMGVNMPARTVVFDSIKKHDGTSLRTLLPGEYIQMAGRAGRRGLDTTGTVIILCKGDVPETSELHKMMLGRPTQLESQFRLTDTMILNLLRVEQLRVEDMMRRSFSEFHAQRHQGSHRQAMDDLKGRIAQVKDIECYMCSEDLEPYYRACKEYQELKRTLQEVVLSHPAAIKSLSAGRVVVINNSHHSNVLAVVLQSSMGSNNMRTFTVLLICNKGHNSDAREATPATNDDMKVTPMKALSLFIPEGVCWHDLVEVTAAQISLITTTTIKVEADKIIKDVKKRQQPRFKDDPPSQSVTVATQELLRLSEKNPGGLKGLDPVKDLNLRDIDLVEQFRSLRFMEEGIGQFQCVHCAKFEEHFTQLSHNMGLKEEYRRLQFLLSDQSLQLLPEYHQRMEVLRALNYIDDHNAVQLKGRVACEISNHELMITELVFENVLTELHPTDIAAILSCMVFEQKHCSDPELSKTLEEGKQKVLSKAEQIGGLQKEAGMKVAVGDYKDMFHFGLMEVVFEWARGMPFSEITALTDVQEGIIVRCIQRLYELLRDVRNAARIIGEPVLFNKMEECMTLIKRDIVFAASLYTQ